MQRGNQYLWRRVPSTESCTVSTESEPPTSVTGVSVGRVETEREGEGLIFELSWSPPVTTNGELTEYEVNVVTDATGEGLLLHHSTYPVSAHHQLLLTLILLHCLLCSGKSALYSSQYHSSIQYLLSLPLCFGETVTILKVL